MDDITSGKLDKAEQDLGRFTGVPEKVKNNLTAFSDTFTTVTDMDQLIGVQGQTFNPKQCDYTTKKLSGLLISEQRIRCDPQPQQI